MSLDRYTQDSRSVVQKFPTGTCDRYEAACDGFASAHLLPSEAFLKVLDAGGETPESNVHRLAACRQVRDSCLPSKPRVHPC